MKRIISILFKLITVIISIGIIAVPSITASATHAVTDTLVAFGYYPQSGVVDTGTLAKLNAESLTWTYYNYYCDYNRENYMQYADVTLSGDRYRAVKFSHYRPKNAWKKSSDTYQDVNGYEPDTVYWFKYEPLVWRVLDADEGLLMAENIIDSQPFTNRSVYYYDGNSVGYYSDYTYKHYASNWAYSDLRSWMNNDFYNTAFDAEKSYIEDTDFSIKENVGPSLGIPSGKNISTPYADPTTDKVFLLSKADVENETYGFRSDADRTAYGTDYAKCQGLLVDASSDNSYSSTSFWRLRNPGGYCKTYYVGYTGSVTSGGFSDGLNAEFTYYGVRPALKVNLQSAIIQSVIKITETDIHTWDSGKVTDAATCISDGVKTYTCVVCGIIRVETVPKDAANHDGGTEIRNGKTATCVADGYTGDTYCKGCGAILSGGTSIPATGIHTWDNGKVTLAATCMAAGENTYTCDVCGQTKTETIPTAAHELTGTAAKAATCTEDGNIQYYTCTVCGKIFSDKNGTIEINEVTIEASGHDFGEWKVTKEATVAEEGIKTRKCSKCGEEEMCPIATLGIVCIIGDVNGDGDILADDARLALRASAKLETLDENQEKAADVDGSGDVLANDARQILRYSAKLQHEFEKK
ncbi:MAG: dockerin type I repeat-containing protein [Clostridia bacterium]|nr:dockerin type I repeat-containing protein [Clostridia bacterium]